MIVGVVGVVGVVEAGATAVAGHEGRPAELRPARGAGAEWRVRRSIGGEGFLGLLSALYR